MYKFIIPNKSTYLLDIKVQTFGNTTNKNKKEIEKNKILPIQVLNLEYTNLLNNTKDRIDKYYTNNTWDKMKKIINPYELIYITNKKYRYRSLSFFEPLSRSYYKMIEMSHLFLKDYYINSILGIGLDKMKGVNSLHLAEGPGGFVEGWRYFREANPDDRLYAITLLSGNKEIPSWKKTDNFLKFHPEVKILTGLDGTGNLYKSENIKYIINRLGEHTMELITGDGGFDFSIGYNIQEQYASKLIYSQVLIALKCQKKGGTFICKFFDTNNKFTIDILYLLQCLYKTMYVYKPYTSRVANSERYIVCCNYLNKINDIYWNKLLSILVMWEENKDIEINTILNGIPIGFMNLLSRINYNTIQLQIKYINDTIDLIENNKTDQWYNENKEKQNELALSWCIEYKIPYNF